MSLFPAYSDANKNDLNQDDQHQESWLKNASFQTNLCLSVISESDGKVELGENPYLKKRKKKSKHKKSKKHKSTDEETVKAVEPKDDRKINEYFNIETKGNKEFLNVITISRPAVSKYTIAYNLFPSSKVHKKQKVIRYFQFRIEDKSDSENEQIISKRDLDKIDYKKEDNSHTFEQEEELSTKTAFYNQHLAQYPCDIQKWIDYVQFQDTVYQFEKVYRKGSAAKAYRVLAERKISIIDKALTKNPDSELLHREKLKIAVSVFPADELQVQLKDLVEKDKGNIILWQGYIEATQCSMSHCTASSVMNLYTKCLSTLHQLRRNTSLEKHVLEESILRMLYQCGLFLKQAGLFEQLWTLLRMYLELNLSPFDKNKFNISSGFDDKQLVELEEIIFTSQLPLQELWLRTEKLRESCHWLPYLDDENCEDPQRLVFTDDVADLIHPITLPENIFKLTATIAALLKIPLLPCRHTTMQDLGLDYVPWSLDSTEPLLSVFFPLYPVDVVTPNFLKDNRLAVGPQYLKTLPGQEEYIQFILLIMKRCSECLNLNYKIGFTIWLLRFQRLLLILDKYNRFSMTDAFRKQIKRNVKELLKCEENRQNALYYLEYALIENELNNSENCLNIINIALTMNNCADIKTSDWDSSQAIWCGLNRNKIHIILNAPYSDQRNQKALFTLCELALKKKGIQKLTPNILNEVEEQFQSITLQILNNHITKLQPLQHFLPDFLSDWIICHGWFIYLKYGIYECINFMKQTLLTMENNNKDAIWQKEVLYEFYLAVIFKHCMEQPINDIFKQLDKVLYNNIEKYPNNLFSLAVLAKRQNMIQSLGLRWWKVQDLLIKSGRALSILFAILITSEHLERIQEKLSGDLGISYKNRMLSLFKKVTSPDICTRRCGLIWRLYLQFVYSYFTPDTCRKVYYSAVEECPWFKVSFQNV